MSEYVALLCDACGYKQPVRDFTISGYERQRARFSWSVYRTDTKEIFPLLVDSHVWCKECEAPVLAEKWPTIERIESEIAELAAEAKAFRRRESLNKLNANLAELFELFCANEQAWRRFAAVQRKTRCLTCGSTEIESLAVVGGSVTDGAVFRFSHGACESTLRAGIVKTGLHVSPKQVHAVIPAEWNASLTAYTTDGLDIEKSTSFKLKEKLPEIAPMLEEMIGDEIARRSGRLSMSSGHTVRGEDEYPEICRELREFVAKEMAGTWRPNEKGTLKTDLPELYALSCQYVREEIAKARRESPGSAHSAHIRAICVKCGAWKSDEFAQCSGCGSQPRTDVELAMSLVLSEHLSSQQDLQKFSTEITMERPIRVNPTAYGKAQAALADKQLLEMILAAKTPDGDNAEKGNATPKTEGTKPQLKQKEVEPVGGGRKSETSIHRSAFWLLGANVRDNRRRIVELAEEKALHLDDEACQKARGDLTNPRTRLSAEIAWMPGVSPKKARDAAEALLANPDFAREQKGLPSLAKANLMITAFETMDGREASDAVSSHILDMAKVTEEWDAEEILRDLNEDRSVSGFPEINAVDIVESELAERRRTYKQIIRDALNNMPAERLVETMTMVADEATLDGELHAPALVDDLVDSYEVETQGFLTKEAENVSALIAKAREIAPNGERSIVQVLDRLEKVVRNWHRVAHPIQISFKARGTDHRLSRDIAYQIRSLGVDLYNKHDMVAVAHRLTDLLSELFEKLPEVAETLEQDAATLQNRASQEAKSAKEKREWAKEIAFEDQIGLVFKDTLKLSTSGVQWKDKLYPLDSITRVRWGAVRNSVNGIPTGTDYTIGVGDNRSEAVIQTRKESVYSGFIAKLWNAVCVRLMVDLLKAMREGKKFAFGEAIVDDTGVELLERHTFSANKRVYCRWDQVTHWSADGSFYLRLKDAKETYASASYMKDANTHLIEHLISLNFKGSDPRLSDALSK